MAVKPKTYWALVENMELDEVKLRFLSVTKKELIRKAARHHFGSATAIRPYEFINKLNIYYRMHNQAFRIAKVRFQEVES